MRERQRRTATHRRLRTRQNFGFSLAFVKALSFNAATSTRCERPQCDPSTSGRRGGGGLAPRTDKGHWADGDEFWKFKNA